MDVWLILLLLWLAPSVILAVVLLIAWLRRLRPSKSEAKRLARLVGKGTSS